MAPDHTLEAIERNTRFDWMPGIWAFIISVVALVASVISAWYAWRTYRYQKQTEMNTSRLSRAEQRRLLAEMVRHLYRNMVASYSLKVKMTAEEFAVYPSEEHLQKMKVVLDDIHLNLFYRNDSEHREMNKLYMELRNYNLEIDVICQHFKDPHIDRDTKERDLGTLLFKSNYLTKRIVFLLGNIWENNEKAFYEEARDIITNEIADKNRQAGTPYDQPFKPYRNPDSYYISTLFADNLKPFLDGFDENVRRECGKNAEGHDKIHMIKF